MNELKYVRLMINGIVVEKLKLGAELRKWEELGVYRKQL